MQSSSCVLAAVVLAVAVLGGQPATAWGTGSWISGRATFFGQDAWSLHQGSCGYGFVCPNRWSNELVSGRDLVALADVDPLWKGGAACGQCLEVRCRDATIRDGFGARFDRSGSQYCKAGHPAVKVKVTDRCDCNYAPNSVSNKRWCCGDAPHLDVSQWALDKIAKDVERWGVFAIEYRTVDCGASIANEAPAVPLEKQARDPHDASYRKGTNCSAQATGSKGSSASKGGLSTEGASGSRANVPKPTYNWKAWLTKKRAQRASPAPTVNWRKWLEKQRAQRASPAPTVNWRKWLEKQRAQRASPAPTVNWRKWLEKQRAQRASAGKVATQNWRQRLDTVRAARAAGKPTPAIKYG